VKIVDRKWNAEELLKLGRSFFESRIYLTAVDLDLFSFLANVPLTAADISKSKNTDPRATATLLDALAAMGLLVKDGRKYLTSPDIVKFLDRDSDISIIPMSEHASALWGRWSMLTDVLRTGKPASQLGAGQRTDAQYHSFIKAMHVVSSRNAELIIPRINTAGAGKMIDIGSALGTYSIAFLRKEPELRVTLFDLPDAIPLARENIEKEGLSDRVEFVSGDFYVDDFPGGHDLAFLSAIIHQNSQEQNRDLYRKISAALIPGGRIIIRDHIVDNTRTSPPAGAIFAINMLVATEGGGTYTFDEIKDDLETAGFKNIRLLQPDTRMEGLVEALK
jgi:predicted O-methyltransferase YrrM